MSLIMIGSIVVLVLTFFLLIIQSVKGKGILERVLALDLIGVTCIGFFVVIYIVTQNKLFMGLASLLTFVSFVSSIVFCTFIPTPRKVSPKCK